MYVKETNQIAIEVEPLYEETQSRPEAEQFFWTYTITLTNHGAEPIQLLSRHWIITDGQGHVEEVKGEGVVGEQPILGPGESYTYTSGCPLATPSGTMRGTYQMVDPKGNMFDAVIPTFYLESKILYH